MKVSSIACKHRWQLSGWTGPNTARGLVSIDYCVNCKEERRRKATAKELAARKADDRDAQETHKLGREWWKRVGEKRGYDAIEEFEKFAEDHPESVAIAQVDDSHFSSSVIGFWVNQSKKKLFCVTGVYLPQHSSGCLEPSAAPRHFHLYPGHLDSLYEALTKMRNLVKARNR